MDRFHLTGLYVELRSDGTYRLHEVDEHLNAKGKLEAIDRFLSLRMGIHNQEAELRGEASPSCLWIWKPEVTVEEFGEYA